MEQFLKNLVTASIHGSVVILAVILLRLVLRKTPKKYICLLWLLAGIRLLIPIEIRSDLSLQPSFTLPTFRFSGAGWAAVLPWLWAMVAIGFAVFSLVSYGKLKRRVKDAVRVRGGWESDKIDTAFILGFIKPRIYIPKGMTQTSQKYILEHERTHLDKGDHWIKMIGFLALALHWFNPLVWVAYILLCKDIEMACDERVVQFLELDERKSYSAALLSCSSRQLHLSANPVAFGEVSVKQRILNVLNYKKPSFWFSLLGVIAFFFVTLCLLTSPENAPEVLSPEEQAKYDTLQKCHEDVEALFAKEEYYYDALASDERGSVQWQTGLYKQGENTMWKYNPSTSPDVTDGRLEYEGEHYAWQSGSWVKTDSQDTEFETWLDLYRWDLEFAELTEQAQTESGSQVTFTTKWEGEDQTIHTSTVSYSYDNSGDLQHIRIEKPNHPTAGRVYLEVTPTSQVFGEPKTVSELFMEAQAAIGEGSVTSEELSVQAEFSKWGVSFRVDDDRLSSRGSDVYYSQNENGFGVISTTDKYWIEKKVDGNWQTLPTITTPQWSGDGFGVAKGSATYGYLDWTPVYGELEPGDYRMGKSFQCYDDGTGYSKRHDFYSEFSIYESVDSSSPEAKAAVERCYAALDELKSRKSIHWLSTMGEDSTMEFWVNGEDFLETAYWPGPDAPEEEWSDFDRSLFPRTDTTVRYNGVGYGTAREDPEVLSSKAIGMQLSTLSPNRGGWTMGTISEDFNMLYFERSNKTITFPEGVGVVSDKMVRFCQTWGVVGLPYDEASAQLTYQFDDNGGLSYLEYKTELDPGNTYTASIRIYDDTAEEIDAKIKPYTENLVVTDFSWEDAQKKYTAEEFNIRKDGFVNTGTSPITGPVEAARLAMKEYPDLRDVFSIEVFRDKTTGMWKVTIKSDVSVQSDYEYRDIYLSDSGATQLLVYEGPVRFDESRK